MDFFLKAKEMACARVSVCVMLWLRTTDMDAVGLSNRATDLLNTHKQSLRTAHFILSLCQPSLHIERIPKLFWATYRLRWARSLEVSPKAFPKT